MLLTRTQKRLGAGRRRRLSSTLVAGLCLAAAGRAPAGVAAGPEAEAVLPISMLMNGDFREPLPSFADAAGQRRIPWWKTSSGARQLLEFEGRPALRTAPGEFASQPIAAYAPTVAGVRIRGQVIGAGRLTLRASLRRADGGVGARRSVELSVGAPGDEARAFEIRMEDLIEAFDGRLPVPRLELELRADEEGGSCSWRDLSLVVPWPAPTPEALRAELEGELDWIIDLWLAKAMDDVGPRRTGFMAFLLDAETGERLFPIDGGHNAFADLLAAALRVRPRADWQAAYERLCEDILTLALDPTTGLPRLWDVEADEPKGRQGVEISRQLAFLIDLAESGPPALRERSAAAARRIGETVLAKGQMPDGGVAVKYRPADGAPDTHLVALRRLDIAAQLGRLARRFDDARWLDAAREAAAVVEYTHHWPGGWSDVDPGFDDMYGHYGERALTLWRDWPDEPIFRRLALGGFEHYEQPWIDACRLGGNVAADQVRCWEIVLGMVELEPELEARVARCLATAVRAHLQGEQYGNGAWGDVTIFGFDPQDHLEVGDLPGTPQNLMQGIAWASELELAAAGGPSEVELRALFTAVFRSSRVAYRRPYGYLSTRTLAAGSNPARGSLGVASAIVSMLARLPAAGEPSEEDSAPK